MAWGVAHETGLLPVEPVRPRPPQHLEGRRSVVTPHPAKFTPVILNRLTGIIDELLVDSEPDRPIVILDPFAGVGGIHALASDRVRTIGIELETEWASARAGTLVGDATRLPVATASVDAVVTSPCYGSRMADHHEARDTSRRITYRHTLGRPLTAGSAGAMQWGPAYRDLHTRAWTEARRVLRPGGLLIVNISNHVRKHQVQTVVEWHLADLLDLGFCLDHVAKVSTPRMRFGANRQARVTAEHVIVMRAPE